MPSTTTITMTGNQDIDGLLGARKWAVQSLTFSFPTSSGEVTGYLAGEEPSYGFETLNTVQRTVVRKIYSDLSAFTNLSFTEVTGGAGDLRFGMTNDTSTAHAYYPSSSEKGGDSWFNNSGAKYDNPVFGTYAYQTFLHEMGHTFGLKHGHEAPGMSPAHDSMEYTVMTYRSYAGSTSNVYTNETGGYAQTYMMYDIAALQHLYGANYTANASDTTYSWNASTGAMSINGVAGSTPYSNRVFMTVWDGGGNDTYDLSNYTTGVTLDLRPGEWTKTSAVQLANLGNGNYARGNVANALLFNGDGRSLIENGRGGSGSDVLIGNQANNVLTGNGGADRLTGGAGADSFLFKAASDTNGTARDVITDFAAGEDKINLDAFGALSFAGTNAFSGTAGQVRYTNNGTTTIVEVDLNGDRVADVQIELSGGIALASTDFTNVGSTATPPPPPPSPPPPPPPAPAPVADEGDNVLTGTDGNDTLDGLGGNDILVGLMGDDTLIGGTGSDTASYAHSDADIQVRLTTTSVQNTYGAGNDKLVSIENLIGGSGDNIFTGSSGANLLDGGAGNDQLSAGGGTDTLIGGLGQDKLTGGSGADIFRFQSALESLGGARDRIMDFTRGSDKIDLSEIDAISGTSANDSFRFVGTTAFSGAAGELRFFKMGTTTVVEADVNGDRIADFQIEVANAVTPTVSDFLL